MTKFALVFLLIVDQQGTPVLECDLPNPGMTLPFYMVAPAAAVVCVNPRRPTRIFRDGFE